MYPKREKGQRYREDKDESDGEIKIRVFGLGRANRQTDQSLVIENGDRPQLACRRLWAKEQM